MICLECQYRPGGARQFLELRDDADGGFLVMAWDYDDLDDDCEPALVPVTYTRAELVGLRDRIDGLLEADAGGAAVPEPDEV